MRRGGAGRAPWRLHPLDFDARLLEQLEALVRAVSGSVVDLRSAAVDDELRACDAGLPGDEHDLPRVVHAHLDERVLLRVNAAAPPRLVRLAVVVREPFRGAIVSEPVNLRHVLRRDHTGELRPFARGAARQGHREVHDEGLDAGSFDLPHGNSARGNLWRDLRFHEGRESATWPSSSAPPRAVSAAGPSRPWTSAALPGTRSPSGP